MIESLDNLGTKLMDLTDNSIYFRVENDFNTSDMGHIYCVEICFDEDEIKRTFVINKENQVYETLLRYTGGDYPVEYLAGIDFKLYQTIENKLESFIKEVHFTYQDAKKLATQDVYVI